MCGGYDHCEDDKISSLNLDEGRTGSKGVRSVSRELGPRQRTPSLCTSTSFVGLLCGGPTDSSFVDSIVTRFYGGFLYDADWTVSPLSENSLVVK